MKLIDFLEVTDENKETAIYDIEKDEVIAVYDGKNSIPKEYNYYHVISITIVAKGITDNRFHVNLKEVHKPDSCPYVDMNCGYHAQCSKCSYDY